MVDFVGADVGKNSDNRRCSGRTVFFRLVGAIY